MADTLPPCPRDDCDAAPEWAGHHYHDRVFGDAPWEAQSHTPPASGWTEADCGLDDGPYITRCYGPRAHPAVADLDGPDAADMSAMLDALERMEQRVLRAERRLADGLPVVRTVGDLTARHIGKRVRVGLKGDPCQLEWIVAGVGTIEVTIEVSHPTPDGELWPESFRTPLDTPCEVLYDARDARGCPESDADGTRVPESDPAPERAAGGIVTTAHYGWCIFDTHAKAIAYADRRARGAGR